MLAPSGDADRRGKHLAAPAQFAVPDKNEAEISGVTKEAASGGQKQLWILDRGESAYPSHQKAVGFALDRAAQRAIPVLHFEEWVKVDSEWNHGHLLRGRYPVHLDQFLLLRFADCNNAIGVSSQKALDRQEDAGNEGREI